jgi:hypothetical protein
MSAPDDLARLEAALRACRRRVRRGRRRAALTFLLAGAAFGTCLYLARTRFSVFVRGRRLALFLLVVGLSVALFVLATRFEADAGREEAAARELEERLARTR